MRGGKGCLGLLSTISGLSNLFDRDTVPFVGCQITRGVFYEDFSTKGLSHSSATFSTGCGSVKINLGAFIYGSGGDARGITRFGSLSEILTSFRNGSLTRGLTRFEGREVSLTGHLCGVRDSLCRVITQGGGRLILFRASCSGVSVGGVRSIGRGGTDLRFRSNGGFCDFGCSGDALFEGFCVPRGTFELPVRVLRSPCGLLLRLFRSGGLGSTASGFMQNMGFIVLPLCKFRGGRGFMFRGDNLGR